MSARRRARKWTRASVVERMRAWEREFGEPPRQADWNPARARLFARAARRRASAQLERAAAFERGGWPSDWTVRQLFGTWNDAIEAAGLRKRRPGRQPRDRELTSRQTAELRAWGSTAGADELAQRMRDVARARADGDNLALRGALYQLAAAAVAWVDQLDGQESEAA